jgi:hypothetical protein
MADHITVLPADLRQAARDHRETAEQLNAAGCADAEVRASLESLGPIFAELRDAGRDLLAERRACYQQQAVAHADLAERLLAIADAWEFHDADGAALLRDVMRDVTGGGS